MKTQNIGAVMLIVALCLMSAALADNAIINGTSNLNEVNNTETNTTIDENDTNVTLETNATNTTESNETSIGNETNYTGVNQTENNTSINETSNQATNPMGNISCIPDFVDGCKRCNSIGNGWIDEDSRCNIGQTCHVGACIGNSTNPAGVNQTTNETNTTLTNNTTSESNVSHESEESEELDDEDERHVCLMNEPYGIEIRYLQLEKGVLRNTLIGAKAIEIINKSNPGANLTDSQVILDELEALLQEIRDADLDENKTLLARNFVDFKKDANILSEDFRESIQVHLNRTLRQQINNATREIDRSAFNDIDNEIRLVKCSLNAERVGTMLSDLNATDSAFIEQVSKCNATESEIRDRLYTAFKNITLEQKQGYLKKIREGSIKSIIANKALMEEMRSGYFERRMDRQEKMMGHIQNKMSELESQRENFLKKFEERMNKTMEKMEKMKEKQQQKMEKLEGKRGGGEE